MVATTTNSAGNTVPTSTYSSAGGSYTLTGNELSTGTGDPVKISNSSIKDLLGYEGTAVDNQGLADAQDKYSQGYLKEVDAYTTAGNTAEENARLARVAGNVKDFQKESKLFQTYGGIRADVASSGFDAGGSSIYLMRASASQGALDRQLIQSNTALEAGGYESQKAASDAEAAAAQAASDAALSLKDTYTTSATNAKTNALNYAVGLATPETSTTTGTTKSTGTTSTSTSTGASLSGPAGYGKATYSGGLLSYAGTGVNFQVVNQSGYAVKPGSLDGDQGYGKTSDTSA